MSGFVLCNEYYENPVFSEDEEKNLAMWHAYEREYELRQELAELESKYENWMVVDEGIVNRDHLAMSDLLTLDSGLLNIDLMQ